MTVSVIGVGLPRTGSLSLKAALELLGFGPAHHMSELYRTPDRWCLWRSAAMGMDVDWDKVFEGYASTTDAPGCWFCGELAAFYPNARFILTVRAFEDWFQSALATVFSQRYANELAVSPFSGTAALLGTRLLQTPGLVLAGSNGQIKEVIRRAFEAHNDFVKNTIECDRLLVFDVAQGWRPLCEFLGIPIPDEPFPSRNSRTNFFEFMRPPADMAQFCEQGA